jgi:hypothetical protein
MRQPGLFAEAPAPAVDEVGAVAGTLRPFFPSTIGGLLDAASSAGWFAAIAFGCIGRTLAGTADPDGVEVKRWAREAFREAGRALDRAEAVKPPARGKA